MKIKIILPFFWILAIITLLVISCGKDDDENPPEKITFSISGAASGPHSKEIFSRKPVFVTILMFRTENQFFA